MPIAIAQETRKRWEPEDFRRAHEAALPYLPAILHRLLPGGKVVGREYHALNPRRRDRHPGSFKINLTSGKWADFACDARGGDVVALVAYLLGLSQVEARQTLLGMIGRTR